MKKMDGSLSRVIPGIAVLFLIFIISNSCTKPAYEGGPGVPDPSGYQVSVGSGYNPDEIRISAGDMVSWRNDGIEIESVTSDDGLFDGILRSKETYSFKFLTVGTYTYHSRMHTGMIGKVVVK